MASGLSHVVTTGSDRLDHIEKKIGARFAHQRFQIFEFGRESRLHDLVPVGDERLCDGFGLDQRILFVRRRVGRNVGMQDQNAHHGRNSGWRFKNASMIFPISA